MRRWIDIVGYQAVWFAAVIGAGAGVAWPGVVAGIVFLAWHLGIAPRPRRVLALAAAGVAVGTVFDGVLAGSGRLAYAVPDGLPAPAWLLAIWASFALTLTCSFAPLQGRLVLASVVGAIGGPLAYLSASRGFGAVEFIAPAPQALLALAAGWAIALPMLAWLSRHAGATEAAASAHAPAGSTP